MEVDKSKCLICEVSRCQKGLAFFRFPKDESRLKMWIKEISPLLDILKIQPHSLKENGRICARHFREKDFINFKQDSLVHNACPSLSVSNLNLNLPKESKVNEKLFIEKTGFENDQSNEASETDIFQCGRCKAQFETLSEFIDHKRFRCHLAYKKSQTIKSTSEKTKSSQTCILPLKENSFINNQLNETLDQGVDSSFSGQVVKVISQEPSTENKILSLVLNENCLFVGKSTDITFPTQIILTPQLPVCQNEIPLGNAIDLSLAEQVVVTPQASANNSILLSNLENESQVNNFIVTANETNTSNREIVYSCPIQNNTGMVISSEVPSNQLVLTSEVPNPSESTENSDHILAFGKLTNATDALQQPLLNFPERNEIEGVEKSNQTEESEFERPKTKLPCSYCGKMFEKPFNLQQHERVHTGERPFQCIICGRAFTQKSNVRKHMMRHKVWPKGKQTLKLKSLQNKEEIKGDLINNIDYFCQYCTLSFKSYSEHKKHLAVHSNFKVYRCIQKGCNETFSDLDEFLSHSKMHSSAEFQCHICFKSFNNLEDLGVHQYDHDTLGKERRNETEIKLKCKVCHARFKTAESLKNHIAVDTHNYQCVHCKSVFCSERFLRRHLFIHMDSSRSKFKCPTCKKTFRTQQNLKNHMFIHLKEKPFTCDHCEKQFASKYRLKRHVAIHLNHYLECPFKKHLGCDKTFYRKDKLRDHVSSHSHCRVRSCRICSKMYWTLSKLHQHMMKNHKASKKEKEMYKCFTCFQTFRKQKQFSLHHCTVEEKSSGVSKISEAKEEKSSEAVSNIEIIMVPFGTSADNLT